MLRSLIVKGLINCQESEFSKFIPLRLGYTRSESVWVNGILLADLGRVCPTAKGSRQIVLVIVIGAAVFHIVLNVAESSCLNTATHREGAEVREHDAQIGQTCPTAFLIKSTIRISSTQTSALCPCCPVAHTYHHRKISPSEGVPITLMMLLPSISE